MCDDTSTCHIPVQSDTAQLLRRTTRIIWDEVPMQNKSNFVAVHTTLCDICKNDQLFGGIPVIMGGDFAQTTPVVPKGSRAAQVNASLRSSWIWPKLSILKLNRNMRLCPGSNNQVFANWIARMSYEPSLHGLIQLPPEITNLYRHTRLFTESIFPTIDLTFPSADSSSSDGAIAGLSLEFLQSLEPSGFPPAQLYLKVGPRLCCYGICTRMKVCVMEHDWLLPVYPGSVSKVVFLEESRMVGYV